MPLFELDSISIFKHKYIIEADTLDKAINSLGKYNLEELTQKHVSENVIESKKITKKEFNELIKKVNKSDVILSNAHLGEKIIFRA